MQLRPIYFISAMTSVPPLVYIVNISDEVSYLLIGLIAILYVLALFLSGSVHLKRGQNTLLWFSIIVPIAWLASSLIGIVNGAGGLNAIRNFFGINLFFLVFLVSVARPSLRDIEISVLLANSLVLASLLLNLENLSLQYILIMFAAQDYRLTYSAAAIISVPAISICIYKLVTPESRSVGELILYSLQLTFGLIISFLVFSKGVFLTIALIFLIYFFVFLLELRTLRQSPAKLLYLFGFTIVFSIIVASPLFELITFLYSNREASNSVRAEQFGYLISELHFWGAGLGTELDSGYKRDDAGYGFELTLVNLLQKMGVFSSVYFLTVCFVLLRSIVFIFKQGLNPVVILSLSLMLACLVSGSFNPLLFSPFSVTLQIFGIYLSFSDLQSST